MKRKSHFTFILILALFIVTVFSPIVPARQVSAQTPNLQDLGTASNPQAVNQNTGGAGGTAADAVSSANPNGAPPNPMASASCITTWAGIPSGFNWDACAAGVMNIIMWIVSWILFIAGLCFDASMYFTIHISDLINGNPGIPVVSIGWTIFRDLANIFFIFILLWIAISTILGINSGKTKELLTHLIVVALLINFSLFITQVVIDASNIVAIHFYNKIVTPQNGAAGSFSGAFMDGLKIQTLYDSSALDTSANATGRAGNALAGLAVGGPGGALIGLLSTGGNPATMLRIVFMGIFGSILMITAAYVFFTAAILFLIRTVVLMFVMILSPLAFLAYVLPSTEHYAEQWKEALFRQSFFAPMYLILAYVVVRTIQSAPFQSIMTVTSGGNGWLNVLTASNQFMPFIMIMINFLLLIGLMLGCILIAKKMEAYGVETAVEFGKSARGFVYRQIVRGTYVSATSSVYGGAVGGVGKLAERIGLKDSGQSLQKHGASVSEKGGKIQKTIDVNELNRKFRASTFGSTEVGQFIRERTTGGAIFGTKAKFGAEKSVEEAYEESEKLRDQAQEVERAEEVKRAAAALDEKENPIVVKTREELLANRPRSLPETSDGKGGMREMTEDEWVKDEQKKETVEIRKRRLSAVQSAVVRLPSTGLIHLRESVINTVIPYATETQVEELMKSTEGGWTLHDKEEFEESYFKKLKDDAEKCQNEFDEFDEKLKAYEQLIREGKIQIDGATGKALKDNKGKALAVGTTLDASGNATGTTYDIPEYQQTQAFKDVYSKTRRFMSLKGFELLNATKFHFSEATKARLAKEGKNPNEQNLLRAVPAVGQIMKWSTAQDIRDPNKTRNFTDQERIDIRWIKDATLAELLIKLREKKDDRTGEYMYRNTDDERKMALATGNFSLLAKDQLWEARMRGFLSGRAASESANTPGSMREMYENARFMGAEVLRETAKKDPIDVIKLLENAFRAFKDNEDGVRMMNFETKQLIKDLIQTKEGWKIGQRMRIAEFQELREKLEKEFREGKKEVQFTDWTDPAQRAAANARLHRTVPPIPPRGGPAPAGGPATP